MIIYNFERGKIVKDNDCFIQSARTVNALNHNLKDKDIIFVYEVTNHLHIMYILNFYIKLNQIKIFLIYKSN